MYYKATDTIIDQIERERRKDVGSENDCTILQIIERKKKRFSVTKNSSKSYLKNNYY